mmetsp:Transcript_19086/g.34714  ORF Transcript_19086/g.34714 Transcript_19086/m.34714 type:complete len:200 (+) Transcript_19086:4430-5029(+)|eukprot:CAMPEP_0204913814 /NCGR_PEP_ID=MMETSP1397-20131031/11671_1 /ASSEMBLY_ACC=CAM_ASM_000891 /TAXON_ID=49980 /ORGANISM="Climacostomum Climacostomum virens, Strain Stock W-24" /LENGTH=199 /DNA_ID=CAMNT_0052085141 /DNA_START=546 /DNA_END=1145 /DNA_ORIENTATION=-
MGCNSSSQKNKHSCQVLSSPKLDSAKFKVVLLGDSSVGKSSIVSRYISDAFEEGMPATVGSSYSEKLVRTCKERKVMLSIWDTGGQERYRCLAPLYYREASAAIVIFSVQDRSSLRACDSWIKELKSAALNSLIVIVGNKVDSHSRQISEAEGKSFAKERSVEYFEVSAKTGKGVTEMFKEIAEILIHKADKALAREAC